MHPLQSALAPDLEHVWLAALDDAGIPPERALLLTRPESASPDGRCAVYMRRGRLVEVEGVDEALLDGLNSTTTKSVEAYRVILWTDRPIESAGALVRHELEHARQIDCRPEVEGLHALAEDVLRGQPGSGRIYQQIPAEADANAAASGWVRSLFGDDRIDRLIAEGSADGPALRRSDPPQDPSDLPERMLDFFVTIAAQCRRWEERPNSPRFSRCLDMEWRGAGVRWKEVVEQQGAV